MKNLFAAICCLMTIAPGVKAQNAKPEYLKGPTTWEFERFALPPGFSPSFPYKGVEELRFSPGMFNKDSVNYFSYAFVARLDNTPGFTQAQVKNYLLVYFKGLCASNAKQRNLTIDTSQITVSTEPGVRMSRSAATPGSGESRITSTGSPTYNAVLHLFGVFADGAPVRLNAEIKVISDPGTQTTFLVYIASPQPKSHPIWQELYQIQKDFPVTSTASPR
jgi:hypothetical protein